MQTRRTQTRLLVVAAVALLLPGASAGSRTASGTTFRVALSPINFDSIDPMLEDHIGDAVVLRAACASLLVYPPKLPPAGYRLVPDLATGQPRISNGGKTYTFTIRRGRRFGVTGDPVTPRDVAQTFNRALDPRLDSVWAAILDDIAGAGAVRAGKAARASGIVVRGRKLILRLTRLPNAEFFGAAATLCILPARLPRDPEGARAPLPTAGPYTITEYAPGRKVVLRRNRFYTGPYRGPVERIEATITDISSLVDAVARGEFDWGLIPPRDIAPRARELASRYGVNKSRFFIRPTGGFVRWLVLNCSRRLFRNNPSLRRAVNFAIDRRALVKERGFRAARPTDQYLPLWFPGFRDAHVYPMTRPNVREALRLAKGHRRTRTAIFYGSEGPQDAATAEIVKRNLKRIGIEVKVRLWPGTVLFEKLATGDGFDVGRVGWLSPPEPPVLHLFDGRAIGKPENQNWSYFDSPAYDRRVERAARLTGQARYGAYRELDVELARDAAPAIAYANDNTMTLVGPRVPRRCVVDNYPSLDLRAACLQP